MMIMTCFELKKIFLKPVNKIVFVILAVSLCVVSYFAIGYVDYVDETGNTTIGIAAASALREEKINGLDILQRMYCERCWKKMRLLTIPKNIFPKM